nr:PTS sugar transporter subunit IIA [Lacticaseibacillus thailandensis]
MGYKDMLNQDLIFLDVSATDRHDLFHQIAAKLKAQGYVKDSYEDALNRREDEFPTGIVFPLINVMLPHADPENVNKAFLAIVKIKKTNQRTSNGL